MTHDGKKKKKVLGLLVKSSERSAGMEVECKSVSHESPRIPRFVT